MVCNINNSAINNRVFSHKEDSSNSVSMVELSCVRVDIVYFANLYTNSKGVSLVELQISDLLATGILQKVLHCALHLILSIPPNDVTTTLCHINSIIPEDLKPKIHIIWTPDDCHEYPGISKSFELATTNDNHYILYFHSKGITRFDGVSRDGNELRLHQVVIADWEWVLFIFRNFTNIDKIGITASEFGWMWYNFWWARATYLSNNEMPLKTERRHYYEDWLARQLTPQGSSEKTEPERRIPSISYNCTFTNCWNLLHNPPHFCNVGSCHDPNQALDGIPCQIIGAVGFPDKGGALITPHCTCRRSWHRGAGRRSRGAAP